MTKSTALWIVVAILVVSTRGAATWNKDDNVNIGVVEDDEKYSKNKLRGPAAEAHALLPPNVTVDMVRNVFRFRKASKARLDAKHRDARMERQRERRERARQKLQSLMEPKNLEPMSQDEVKEAIEEDHPWVRRTGWRSGGRNGDSGYDPYGLAGMASVGDEYDKWQQAYRMLGGYIDCDHGKSDDDHKSGDNDQEDREGACSRWMVWASYVDPNYQGGGYDEYFGDNPTGTLDCHNPDTEWELLGVYRQEFYQFIEQISKHLWAIDEYEYVVALAGLSYMTDFDCFYVGADSSGNSIYAGVAPQPEGKFVMALYTDDYCLTPNEGLGMTFDDFGLTTNIALSSQDKNEDGGDGGGDGDSYGSDVYGWWQDTQEYTLTNLNNVYKSFTFCTSCVDYPTYQDGYFIGDYGTDDDDLINQCWKFYSHDSFTCESDCIAMAHAQGTVLGFEYGGVTWGTILSEFYSSSGSKSESAEEKIFESRWSQLLANIFVTFSFIVFVATFLAFAVARRSRHRERSSKSRRLLDDSGRGGSRSRSRRSRSRGKSVSAGNGGDGLFRSSRSKSGDRVRKNRSKSGSRRSRRDTGKDSTTKSKTYEPPSSRKSASRKTRRNLDDF